MLDAGANIGAAAGALVDSLPNEFEGLNDPRTSIGLGCAVTELGAVAGVVADGTAALAASVSDAGEIGAAVVVGG